MKIEEFKMKVTSGQSRIVQEVVIKNGGFWGAHEYTVQNVDHPFLYFQNKMLSYGDSEDVFENENLPELTFQQFKEKYIYEEFVLPGKWCVKDCEEVAKYAADKWDCTNFVYTAEFYHEHEELAEGYGFYRQIQPGYTEITLDQFKKHVLKQDDMEEDKKIIGYKWKPGFQKYQSAAKEIAHVRYLDVEFQGCNFHKNSRTHHFLKEAGVIDKWFDPVYKEEKKLPVINRYDGHLTKDLVLYGSASFLIDGIFRLSSAIKDFTKDYDTQKNMGNRRIVSVTLDSGVTITTDQLNQIVEYIQSRD